MAVTHAKVSILSDSADADQVQPSDWNDDHVGAELNIEGGQSVIQVHGDMGATETFDPTLGNVHTGTLNANCVYTLGAPVGSGACEIEIEITASGTFTETWPGSVTWIGGVAPTPPASGQTRLVVLRTLDGGTSWKGIPVAGGAFTANDYVGTAPYWTVGTGTSFTANRASLIRAMVYAPVTVSSVRFRVTAQAGNLDFGIYDTSLNRLGSTGSFACPAIGDRSQALTASVALAPGPYYFAVSGSTNSGLGIVAVIPTNQVFSGWSLYLREESAFPLPSSIATPDATEDSAAVYKFYFVP